MHMKCFISSTISPMCGLSPSGTLIYSTAVSISYTIFLQETCAEQLVAQSDWEAQFMGRGGFNARAHEFLDKGESF